MRFVAFGQKFEVVLESHWFLYRFPIFNITLNACQYIYVLDSTYWQKKQKMVSNAKNILF